MGQSPAVLMHNSNFSNNSAGSYDAQYYELSWGAPRTGGGAVSIWGFESVLVCTNSTFSDNHGGIGGAVWGNEYSSVEIRHSTLSGNSAVLGGAVVFVGVAKARINNSIITNNNGQEGGAVYIRGFEFPYPDDVARKRAAINTFDGNAIIWIANTMISNNKAFLGGGGVQISGVSILCTYCNFHANTAQFSGVGVMNGGGGIKARFRALIILRNSNITACKAYKGGGMSLEDSALVATSLHMAGNYASQFGGAIEFRLATYSTVRGPIVAEFHGCSIERNHAYRGGKNKDVVCAGIEQSWYVAGRSIVIQI